MTKNERNLLDLFSSESYLTVNKKLLSAFGPNKAIYISNLVDKYRYFESTGALRKNAFFQIHEEQIESTGMGLRQLLSCKQFFIEIEVLHVKKIGTPAKEWYTLDIENLMQAVDSYKNGKVPAGTHSGIRNAVDNFKQNVGTSQDVSYVSSQDVSYVTNNNNKIKRTLYNTLPPASKKSQKTDKEADYLPIAEKLKTAIQKKKNCTIPANQVKAWATEIRKLKEELDISIYRIQAAVDWYFLNIGGLYIPVIESGAALRKKFLSLESAIERSEAHQKYKPAKNPSGSLSNKTTAEIKQLTEQYNDF